MKNPGFSRFTISATLAEEFKLVDMVSEGKWILFVSAAMNWEREEKRHALGR